MIFSMTGLRSIQIIDADRLRHTDDMHGDVDEMERLLSELLTCARLNSTAPSLQMQKGEPAPWLAKSIKDFKAMHPDIALDFKLEQEGKVSFEPFT